jgi:hypothetical protein
MGYVGTIGSSRQSAGKPPVKLPPPVKVPPPPPQSNSAKQ